MGKLTEKQKHTLEAIGKEGQNFKIRDILLEEPVANIDNRLTTVYEGLKDHLRYVEEYFSVFSRRILNDKNEDVKARLLSLNSKIRKAKKKRG